MVLFFYMDTLPPLPLKRKKREQEVTPKVLKWFRENYVGSCAIEIKSSSGGKISESSVTEDQRTALKSASTASIVHKIADSKRKNPFDAFVLSGVPAYVVACFPSRGVALAIRIEKWKGATHVTPCEFRIDL